MRLITIFLLPSHCYLTKHFQNFLDEKLEFDVRERLERSDLGEMGSFGGKQSPTDSLRKDGIVFVHGTAETAGSRMKDHSMKFRTFGYDTNALYATTFADGDRGNPLQWTSYCMKCKHVKQIRAFILAVRLYTDRKVDVIAYSLGVPIAIKAIQGGKCVDTGENLGVNIGHHIDTFIGIAGPNHGVALKVVPGVNVPACALGFLPICNGINGLFSGVCPIKSAFLQDINERTNSKLATHSYSIMSTGDEIVGYKVCDELTSTIVHQNGSKVFTAIGHAQVLDYSARVQYKMIEDHVFDN